MTRPIPETKRRELAVRASVDVRTLGKILRGEPVRGLAGDRARAVLEAEGIKVPTPRPRSRRHREAPEAIE